MAVRCGLTMLSMFTARNKKVNGTKTCHMCWWVFVRYIHQNSAFEGQRFKRYGCSEPSMFSDLVCRYASQCDAKQDITSGKEC